MELHDREPAMQDYQSSLPENHEHAMNMWSLNYCSVSLSFSL